LNRFSYFSNPFYLTHYGLWENMNGEDIVFEKDVVDGEFNLLFCPRKEKNLANQRIGTAFDEDIKKIEELNLKITVKKALGVEYVYRTDEFARLEGADFRSFRKSINRFKKSYKFKVLSKYPKKKVLEFLDEWVKKKDLSGKTELTKEIFHSDLEACKDYLNMLDKIPNKQVYIEIDGKLAGFAVFLPLLDNLWVNLMQKVDYQYEGITKFLYHLKAKKMEGIEFFTTGAEAQDPKLAESKENLHPVKKLQIYFLYIGDK